MRVAFASLLISSAIFAAQADPQAFPDEAQAHGYRMLDKSPRARAYTTWNTIQVTEAEFREMKRRYRPQDFDMWAKRLRQLRPGMTEKQVMQTLRPNQCRIELVHSGSFSDIIELNDAYFAQVFFDEQTKRMISTTTPLATTYEIKPDHQKPPKT
jgi:hypothetical protein